MHPAGNDSTVWMPTTDAEKEVVRQQMNRLLKTSHFNNSRRYPALFRFIVEETLAGRGQYLKERRLGVEVFGRPADYDTAADPIVRVTVAEIRKRIAQYYHEEAHESEMRIELNPGCYEPEFRPRKELVLEPAVALAVAGTALEPDVHEDAHALSRSVGHPPATPARRALFRTLGYTIAALGLAALAWWSWTLTHPSALDELWNPVVANHRTITFCLPTGAARDLGATPIAAGIIPAPASATATTLPSRNPTFLDYETLGEDVVFSDALAALRISNLISSRKHDFRYRLTSSTSLDDLRQGPDIMIGGLDNQWTLRAISGLRFRFAGVDRDRFWIVDTKDPSRKDWALDLKRQFGAVTRDYAIIARLHGGATGQVEMIVAGIGMSGTAAAGEFLIDAGQAEQLRQKIGPGFRDRDFEAVLSTDVVNGVAGPPKILTTAVW